MDKVTSAYQGMITLFRSSLQSYMPFGSYRDFHIWTSEQENPQYKVWCQIIGLPQLAKLTVTLLDGLVTDDKWSALMEYASWLNVYLTYEAISDNLAIGLTRSRHNDPTADIRKRVLLGFNAAMVARLNGEYTHSQNLLASIEGDARHISAFKQSLTEPELREMAAYYVSQNQDVDVDEVEYGAWAALVANIEACAFVVESFKDTRLGNDLRKGLIWRYEAVGRLLADDDLSVETIKSLSTHSILVIPVLVYYVSVLMEYLYPNSQLDTVIHRGILTEALEDAALMVRLTNDLGTGLVVSKEHFSDLFNQLYQSINEYSEGTTLGDFLLNAALSNDMLTRIHKDLEYGEYNVSLNNLIDVPISPETLLLFATNVVYFADCYQQCNTRLMANLARLTNILGDDRISHLILRFVKFHEYIYSYRYDNQAGDYATKPRQSA